MKKCCDCDWFITCQREDKTPQNHDCEYYQRTYLQRYLKELDKEKLKGNK